MKVAVYYNNNDIRIEERKIPSISDNEILVKMCACGICGTDIMEWYRLRKPPRVLGHEMTGVVEAIGLKIKKFRKSDRVFVSHHVPCYKCHYCVKGNFTACELFHTGNFDPGGFAEFVRIPEENVKHGTFILPENITFEEGAMIEPLGCVIAGQKRVGLKKDQTVFIIGCGVSGLLHIQLAKIKKAKIIAMDINKFKLDKALEFGAHHIIDAKSYSIDVLKSINDGKLADIVIVCAAAQQAVDNALLSIDRRGTILFFAIPQNDIIIPSLSFWRDEIILTFSYGASPDDLKEAIEFISSGKINAKKMITHTVQLSNIQQGFQIASESSNSLKVVVVPNA